jgi:hypothetical protein
VMLTTHLHLVPRSRMGGAIPPLLQCTYMVWCLVKYRDDFTFYLLSDRNASTCKSLAVQNLRNYA